MHLDSHKAVEKFKKCDFFFVGRKTEKPMFLEVRKSFVKAKPDCKTFAKIFLQDLLILWDLWMVL